MRKAILQLLSVALLATGSVFLLSWGNWGHQHINHAAVFALPDEMRHFFYNHIDFITEESVIPDIRKYTINDKAEFPRHYIDLETFEPNDPTALPPQTMKAAEEKYGAAFLNKNGILPWYIMEVAQKLTKAFQDKKKGEILFLAADLGHYLADANMPLHTSVNHDGQFTDQKGIHAFFESQLPEQFGNNCNFYTGPATYIENIQAETWRIVLASHHLADSVLLIEKNLRKRVGTANMYVKDSAGNIVRNKFNQPVHTYEYARAYHDALNGMLEKQLRTAVANTADFWYTAWVNAGKPDLDELDEPSLTKRNNRNYKKDYQLWKKGRLFGFKINREF
ncbi:MAG: zinc dependent phospholipase C family protein [Bacteroidota bacterium]